MQCDKETIESLINNSDVFVLEPGTIRYRREALKLVELLYTYLMSINRDKYEEYGLEITETANRCLKNYDINTGPFLNYFNAAWKREYRHAIGRDLVGESYSGIKFPETIQRKLRSYFKYAQSMNQDYHSTEVENNVAQALNISLDDYRELAAIIENQTISEFTKGKDGDEHSLFDSLVSEKSVEEELFNAEMAESYIKVLNQKYNELQERQKPILKDLITFRLSELIAENVIDIRLVRNRVFFNKELYFECRKGNVTMRLIAEMHSVKEQSASRTWKVFKEKVEKSIKGEINGLK